MLAPPGPGTGQVNVTPSVAQVDARPVCGGGLAADGPGRIAALGGRRLAPGHPEDRAIRLLTCFPILALALVVAACQSSSGSPTPAITIPLPTPSIASTPRPTAAVTPRTTTTASPRPTSGGSAVPSASPRATGGPRATPSGAPSANASALPPSRLDWKPCGGSMECATLNVPLDAINPVGSPTIKIALVRLPASGPGRRIGSLLVNPGGPGASGASFVRDNATALFSVDLRARFDIVGFDPRGVGESTPIECVDDATLDRLNANDPTPDDAAERQALIDGAREFAAACQRRSGELLPFMSTEQAARDMERIRITLGEEQISYLGFSYGTFLGATYANLFPTRVRAFVLDGAVDPIQGFQQSLETQGKGFADALERFLANCESVAACFFNGGRDVRTAFDALMKQIDAEPLPALAIDDPRPVGPGEAFTGVLSALYDRGSWSILAQGLELARRGDGSLLLLLADSYNRRGPDGRYENIAAANNAVNCADYVVPTDVAAYDAMVPRLEAIAPRFGEAIAYSGLACAFWPVHPDAWAEKLASTLESGILLTYEGEGHTAYGGKSACIDGAIDRYLIDLALPPDGTRCT